MTRETILWSYGELQRYLADRGLSRQDSSSKLPQAAHNLFKQVAKASCRNERSVVNVSCAISSQLLQQRELDVDAFHHFNDHANP